MAAPSHLIIVCCHSIWNGGPSGGASEDEWLIADFQRGETATFVEHIKAGIRCLAEDYDNAALVFSGGPTRKETSLSEAQSYADVASAHNFFNLVSYPQSAHFANPSPKILIEDRALDSYHNVLFSLTLFRTRFNAWPASITIVSHAFKKPRLVNGHCAAIGFPLGRTAFIGIDPPGMVSGENEAAIRGAAQAVEEWAADPHGRGEKLAGKRAARNPWGVWQGVFEETINDGAGRGGLVTTGIGGNETLVDDAPRPWA
ncbi:hypothetical protein Trco_006243 [Trichoderma cornu-damae]|uniref:DUF218 domain-containing protein n=1 Tax=Trichoderma cornu-damae TaxID=654480 RepID=A0A9P8TRR6_9HYPO|nr:hypothetical protein Trco_006243 [Trichoderma cornu-damae]